VTSDATEPVPAGLTKERLSFFTDAVFAIAMTLLVIEIPRPEGPEFSVADGASRSEVSARLVNFLADHTSSFFAYVLAFLMIWTVWRQHHTLMDRIARASPAMVAWHLPLLLVVGFLPYATSVFGTYTDNPAAALLYGLTFGVLLTCRSVVQSLATRDRLLLRSVSEAGHRYTSTVSWIVTAYWLVSLLLVWWTPWVAIYWILTPMLGPALGRLLAQQRPEHASVADRTTVGKTSRHA
jgi:uncharacterized membrane protein